jgi:hypothetical protein
MQSEASKVDGDAGATEHRPMVDSTLVDATLALTPEERLRQNDRALRMIKELRDGFAARRADDAAIEAGGRPG